ncbi:MAG TPA: hypothetical protein VE593_10490, partial [Nitrososphaeraceae archaeon]|nr:hypothetical protein [Nitrososphaeraceae archaeon]
MPKQDNQGKLIFRSRSVNGVSTCIFRASCNNQHLKIGQNNPLKMAAHKTASRKKRLLKHTKQNRPVPAWVIIRTHRNVRTNPKR